MSGLITFSLGGVSFMAIGLHEALSVPSVEALRRRYASAAVLSSLAVIYIIFSILFSSPSSTLAVPSHLSSLPIPVLFLLYALAGLLASSPRPHLRSLLPLPSSALDFILLAAFLLELLSLHTLAHPRNPAGIENRYLDLLLVPVLICASATLLALVHPRSPFPTLARAAGLALHGSWLVQMGFSFFSTALAQGCSLQEHKGDYFTVKCKGHMEYHRGRALATLQFNCHLAALVIASVGLYSAFGAGERSGDVDYDKYRPLGEIRPGFADSNGGAVHTSRFTLDSDDDEELERGRSPAAAAAKVTPANTSEILAEPEQLPK